MARYCIFRTDRIGDVVLTLPMAEALTRHDPEAHVTVCVQEYTGELAALCPFVDEVISIPGRDLARDRAGWPQVLREREFDAALFAFPRPRLARAAQRARIPVRVGTAFRWYAPLFTHRVHEHRQPSVMHERDYNLNLLRSIDIPVPDNLLPKLDIPSALREEARAVVAASGIRDGRPYGVLHPGSGGSAKDWPPERFAELAFTLVSVNPDLQLLLTGSASERALLERVQQDAGSQVHLLERPVPLAQLAGILEGAVFTVANSTGPLHIAAAAGTPVLGLYPFERVTHPRRWGPLGPRAAVLTPDPEAQCSDCLRGRCRRHDDMLRISAHAAFTALMALDPL